MSDLTVISRDALTFEGATYRCAVGANGFSANRREGSKTTPIGRFALRECWYRPDRFPAPSTSLPARAIRPEDGWCDDPTHADYNRRVTLPFTASHEKLWRDDHVYDIVIPLGFNDNPPIPGKGSAIFLHLARPDYAPTEGCVALSLEDMKKILPHLGKETFIGVAPKV